MKYLQAKQRQTDAWGEVCFFSPLGYIFLFVFIYLIITENYISCRHDCTFSLQVFMSTTLTLFFSGLEDTSVLKLRLTASASKARAGKNSLEIKHQIQTDFYSQSTNPRSPSCLLLHQKNDYIEDPMVHYSWSLLSIT